MKTRSTFIAGLTTVISTLAFSASLTLVPVSSAQAWWACNSGWELQVANNNKVRCYLPGSSKTKNTLSCPQVKVPGTNVKVGTTKKKNYKGNADKCVVLQSGFNVPVGCQGGYQLQINSSWDKCVKSTPAQQKAPDRNVN